MKKLFVLFLFFFALCVFSVSPAQCLEYETKDANAPIVYFTRDISPQGLMKVYKALGQKIEGSVGMKISFGAPNESVLNPQLLSAIVKETNATMFDGNGLSGNRATAEQNLAHARKHGFDKIGKMTMMNEDSLDMPVSGGHLLKYARTGTNFNQFDTLIAVHRFRMHYLPIYGGNVKNITLCLSNLSGKCIIHSGGADERNYRQMSADVDMKSFADAAKAVTTYKKNWAFINVIDAFDSEDEHNANRKDVGIVASLDVVAADRCAMDLEFESMNASAEQRKEWEEVHSAGILKYAEEIGVGSRKYRLVSVD